MAAKITDWEARVRVILGNPTETIIPTSPDVTSAVRAAVRQFSKDSPRVETFDFAGDGATFDIPVPTAPVAWVNRFSWVVSVEYPQGQREAAYLDLQEVTLYPDRRAPTHIRLIDTTPGAGQTARTAFAVPWPIPDSDAATDLIPDHDFEAVATFAAHVCARELAARAAGHKRSTMPSADLVGHETEEDRWRRIAKDCREFYEAHMGTADGPPAASGRIDWDLRSTWRRIGRGFLWRGRR